MKLIVVVLSLILVSVLGEDEYLNVELSPRRGIAPVPLQESNVNSYSNLNSKRRSLNDESDDITSTMINSLLRGDFDQETQVLRSNSGNNDSDDSSLGYWATYPEAAAFDAKIKARLSSSQILSAKPEIRNKITKLAEDKFNNCKRLTEDRERACLGRSTGQIMQLVAAVENINRNPQ